MGNVKSRCSSNDIKENNNLVQLKKEINYYKENFNNINESFKCSICMDNYIDLTPSCGHMGICNQCYNNRSFISKNKCILCRKNVKYIKLFLPYSFNNKKITSVNKLSKNHFNFFINENINELTIINDELKEKYYEKSQEINNLNYIIKNIDNKNNRLEKELKLIKNKYKEVNNENIKLLNILEQVTEDLEECNIKKNELVLEDYNSDNNNTLDEQQIVVN